MDSPQRRSIRDWRHFKHLSSNRTTGITVSTLIVTYILNVDFKWRQQVSLTLFTLHLKKDCTIPVEQEVRWTSDVIWTKWQRGNSNTLLWIEPECANLSSWHYWSGSYVHELDIVIRCAGRPIRKVIHNSTSWQLCQCFINIQSTFSHRM